MQMSPCPNSPSNLLSPPPAMTRHCSHCSANGHNSRTCPSRGGSGSGGGGVKLFGVRLTDESSMKKSASMGNLTHYHSSPNPASPSSDPVPDAYLSDDPVHAASSSNRPADRKKGTPWTFEEHRRFLLGLQKLGKGDWRGISRNFVISRTPTQVASHAQKHFIRRSNASGRKRRSSLFDMVSDTGNDSQQVPEEAILPSPAPQTAEPTTTKTNSFPLLDLSLGAKAAELEPMETTLSKQAEEEPPREEQVAALLGDLKHHPLPSFYPAFVPYPFPLWPSYIVQTEESNGAQTTTSHHQVLKPTPIVPKEPVNVDELVGLSKLKLSETKSGHNGTPQLSLNLLGAPSRQSAFHSSTAPPLEQSRSD